MENPTPKISVKNCGFNRGFTEEKNYWSVVLRNDKKCTNFSMNKNKRCKVFKDFCTGNFRSTVEILFSFSEICFLPTLVNSWNPFDSPPHGYCMNNCKNYSNNINTPFVFVKKYSFCDLLHKRTHYSFYHQ